MFLCLFIVKKFLMRKYIVLSEDYKTFLFEVQNFLCLIYYLYNLKPEYRIKTLKEISLVKEIVTYKKFYLIDFELFFKENMMSKFLIKELIYYLNRNAWFNEKYEGKVIFTEIVFNVNEKEDEYVIFLLCSGIHGIRISLSKKVNENLKKSKIKSIEIIDLELDLIEKEIKVESLLDLKKFKTIEEVLNSV